MDAHLLDTRSALRRRGLRSSAALGILLAFAACSSPRARSVVLAGDAPAPIGPYSQAVWAGDTLYLAGQIGVDPASGELAPDIEAQTRRALANLDLVLDAAGLSLADVASTVVYLTDLGEFARMNAVYAEHFRDAPPARATVGVAALPRGARVEISCVAVRPR